MAQTEQPGRSLRSRRLPVGWARNGVPRWPGAPCRVTVIGSEGRPRLRIPQGDGIGIERDGIEESSGPPTAARARGHENRGPRRRPRHPGGAAAIAAAGPSVGSIECSLVLEGAGRLAIQPTGEVAPGPRAAGVGLRSGRPTAPAVRATLLLSTAVGRPGGGGIAGARGCRARLDRLVAVSVPRLRAGPGRCRRADRRRRCRALGHGGHGPLGNGAHRLRIRATDRADGRWGPSRTGRRGRAPDFERAGDWSSRDHPTVIGPSAPVLTTSRSPRRGVCSRCDAADFGGYRGTFPPDQRSNRQCPRATTRTSQTDTPL